MPGGSEIGHLAERFREMARRLSEAEQLERNFLMSVSHELRTPLTAIRGHVAALSEGLVEDADGARHLARHRRRGDRAALAARRRRPRPGEARRAPLHACSRRRSTWSTSSSAPTRRSTRRRGGAGSTTAASCSAQPGADHRRRPRAPDHHEPAVERVPLDARRRPDRARARRRTTARSRCRSPTPGPGIAATEQERIFRPFWSRDGGGTGLGLAIANELAHALGGRIDLETEVGRGSTFELVLPSGS